MELICSCLRQTRGSAESARHMSPNASFADPHFQRNCCGVFGLHLKCDWDGKPCRSARVSAAINKDSTHQHSSR
jgi:hypothetical protein